jgi:hypothetical protein
MPIVTVGIMAAGAGLSMLSASSANKAAKREAEARTRRAAAAAKLTRDVNIPIQRAQAAQQREKVSRDTNLLLGQLVVSAAERGVLESQSTEQGIQTILQGMSYNLSQINANRYMAEQQILAQTQYPDVYSYQPQNVLLAGLQGGLQGLSMGMDVAAGMRAAFPPSQVPVGMGQSGAWGGGSFTPSSGNIGGSGAFGVPSIAGGPNA